MIAAAAVAAGDLSKADILAAARIGSQIEDARRTFYGSQDPDDPPPPEQVRQIHLLMARRDLGLYRRRLRELRPKMSGSELDIAAAVLAQLGDDASRARTKRREAKDSRRRNRGQR